MLGYRLFLADGSTDIVQQPTATVTPEPAEERVEVVTTPEEITPTPTLVIEETEEATAEPTAEPTATPTIKPITQPTGAPTAAAITQVTSVIQIEEHLKNGGFDEGFDEATGLGSNWQGFTTGSASMAFSQETAGPLIHDGSSAQRISIENAYEPDRYAGIYQKVEVSPNQTYTFTIHGQVRSLFGDVDQSGYGYRVQYAVDQQGGEDWQAITDTAWVELPWGEEPLYSAQFSFSEYTSQITAESEQLTLFVRVWNKWADPKLVEYTLDSLSLVGPTVSVVNVRPTGTEEELIDQALPVTGTGDPNNFMNDGRFWGALLILLLLIIGAIYRTKWRW
jgi:hypothetical protein